MFKQVPHSFRHQWRLRWAEVLLMSHQCNFVRIQPQNEYLHLSGRGQQWRCKSSRHHHTKTTWNVSSQNGYQGNRPSCTTLHRLQRESRSCRKTDQSMADKEHFEEDRMQCLICEVVYIDSNVQWYRCKNCKYWVCGDCTVVSVSVKRKKASVFVCANWK